MPITLYREQHVNTDLEQELRRYRSENEELVNTVRLQGGGSEPHSRRGNSEPLPRQINKPLEKSLKNCFRFAHELLKDIKNLIENDFKNPDTNTKNRLDDRLHLMLMELINVHGEVENLGLVSRVDIGIPKKRKKWF